MGARTTVGIVGAGRAGSALAVALVRAGWPVRAIASRDPERRARVASRVPGVLVVADPATVAAAADLVLLAVPDDAIGPLATSLGARSGTIVAHLSGVHPAEVLRGSVVPGVVVGAFHPLVAFADVERAVEALSGAYVAIDGDPVARVVLGAMAEALGARPIVLGAGKGAADPATRKAAHHAAAVLAAGGFVALLDAIAELGRGAGLDETTAVEVYGSLVRQGLANASALGVAGALTGPVVRGDIGTLRAHLDVMATVAPDVLDVYLATARRQLAIALRGEALGSDAADALADELARP